MSRYISMKPNKRKNMGWDFLIRALRLSIVWILFFSTVDLAAKQDPDPAPMEKPVIVAVIDTGCDLNHELLKNRIWENPGEIGMDSKGRNKRSNGIDDDGNGYVDDVHGWNFVQENNNLEDQVGHGTHIAGIIAARPSPQYDFQGLAPNAKIMVLKYFDSSNSGKDNMQQSIDAMNYALQMKAQIINYSGGGPEFSTEEYRLMLQAQKKGILVVAAAGNERSNADLKPFYPGSYPLTNILSVAAVDPGQKLVPSSNYGSRSVNLAAPGFQILSTVPGNQFGMMTGTSQATAFVTGSAARLMGQGPRSLDQIRSLIMASVEIKSSLKNRVSSEGTLNLQRALEMKSSNQTALGKFIEPKSLPENNAFLWKVSDTIL